MLSALVGEKGAMKGVGGGGGKYDTIHGWGYEAIMTVIPKIEDFQVDGVGWKPGAAVHYGLLDRGCVGKILRGTNCVLSCLR